MSDKVTVSALYRVVFFGKFLHAVLIGKTYLYHSVDRDELAREISKRSEKAEHRHKAAHPQSVRMGQAQVGFVTGFGRIAAFGVFVSDIDTAKREDNMPSCITHQLISERARELLPEPVKEAAERRHDYYFLGAQGPDVFFFYERISDTVRTATRRAQTLSRARAVCRGFPQVLRRGGRAARQARTICSNKP